jgi:hypothetical protein
MIAAGALALSLLNLTLFAWVVGTSVVDVLGDPARAPIFALLLCGAAVAYFAAVRRVLRDPAGFPLALVLGVAVALRVLPFLTNNFLSSDLYRYVWDGMVQAAGINPFLHIPADSALSFLRDSAIFPHINRADYAPTIYPPAAQLVFAAVGLVHPSQATMKLVMVGFEALAVGCAVALLRMMGKPAPQVLIYAWNPLCLWEYAGNGHVDAMAIGLIALALLLRARLRDGWAGAVFALAVLVKFLPVAIGPALWRSKGAARLVAAGLGVGIVLYGGYMIWDGAGLKVLGFLGGYEREEGLNDGSGLWPLAVLGQVMTVPGWLSKTYLALVAAGLVTLALRVMGARRDAQNDTAFLCGQAGLMMTCVILAVTPHYPWYYGVLSLFATLQPSRALIWLGAAPVVLYAAPAGEMVLWPAAIFLPAALFVLSDLRPSAKTLTPQGTM